MVLDQESTLKATFLKERMKLRFEGNRISLFIALEDFVEAAFEI
jgi:hypothetical protein